MNEVDKYMAEFPVEVQEVLQTVRSIILNAAPDAFEKLAYGMPGYKLKGKPFVYFAGYAKHVGLYATPVAHEAFAEELKGYKQGKGSVQFPLNKPMPFDLIKRIIEFKLKQLIFN
jgi:uncharacterized protein YdhG (YjbR/CyaY superfamily)